MTCNGHARIATCLVAATFVGASAAVFAPSARADDPPAAPGLPPELAIAMTTDDADAADEAFAEVEDAIETAVAALDGPPEAAPETAPTEAPAGSGDVNGATAPAAPAAEPEESAKTSQTSADTTPDTAPAAASPPVAATQTAPTNVNVSVRIGSPGDNGPVTQVNVAAALGSAVDAATTPPVAAAMPTSAAAAPAGTVSPGGSTPISPAGAKDSGWTWQWDCASAPSFDGLSPEAYGGGSIPANWTWIWNCGQNTPQYQNATAGQYQPVNVNVSIRVASPGNNGPVSQANIAVAVSAGDGSPRSNPVSSGDDTASSVSALPLPITATVAFVSPPAVLSPFLSAVPATAETSAVSDEIVDVLTPWLEGAPAPSVSPGAALNVDAPVGVLRPRPAPFTVGSRGELVPIRPALGAVGLPVPAIRASGVPTRGDAKQPATASKRARPVSQWQTPVPKVPAPKRAPSGTSAASAAGGASSSGSLPIFLALPFLAAMLDLARRVALDRIATPSGHRSRIPDTPG